MAIDQEQIIMVQKIEQEICRGVHKLMPNSYLKKVHACSHIMIGHKNKNEFPLIVL